MTNTYRITTPVPGFTGVSAGVNFTGGAAELHVRSNDPQDEQRRRLAYFREAGYGVTEIDEDGEPVQRTGEPDAPLPSDDAPDWKWRMYAVQHAGMTEADVDALGDRADVMRAVRERLARRGAATTTAMEQTDGEAVDEQADQPAPDAPAVDEPAKRRTRKATSEGDQK